MKNLIMRLLKGQPRVPEWEPQPLAVELTLLIDRLAAPLRDDEASEGWDAESKAAIRAYFEKRRDQAEQGFLEPDYGLVRGLDCWGVGRGDLHSEALRVNRLLH